MHGAFPADTGIYERELEGGSYVPPVHQPAPTVGERLAVVVRACTGSPGRTALATVALVGALLFALFMRPVTVHATDSRAPLTAHCGMSYQLFGHPNPVVRQVCQSAYAGRAAAAMASGAVALVAGFALLGTIVFHEERRRRSRAVRYWRMVAGTAPRAALLTLAACAFVVGAVALRTVPVHGSDEAGPYTAHCGFGYAILQDGGDPVDVACRQAFASHATVLLISALVIATSLVVLAAVVFLGRRVEEDAP